MSAEKPTRAKAKAKAKCLMVRLPLHTVSEANRRDHWAVKCARTKTLRETAHLMVWSALRKYRVGPPPWTVTLTRIGPRKLDPDNLTGALKAVQDGVADALGKDDGSDAYEWRWEQVRGDAGEYAVLVSILGEEP